MKDRLSMAGNTEITLRDFISSEVDFTRNSEQGIKVKIIETIENPEPLENKICEETNSKGYFSFDTPSITEHEKAIENAFGTRGGALAQENYAKGIMQLKDNGFSVVPNPNIYYYDSNGSPIGQKIYRTYKDGTKEITKFVKDMEMTVQLNPKTRTWTLSHLRTPELVINNGCVQNMTTNVLDNIEKYVPKRFQKQAIESVKQFAESIFQHIR